MKTPPFLLGAVLLFWGWQTGFLAAGAVMAVILESSRLFRVRWDFSEVDFARIWMVCAVLFLAGFAFAFTTSDGVAGLRSLLENPGPSSQRAVSTLGARTAATFISWLPMVFFLFMAAQAFHTRDEVPLTAISFWRMRRRRAQRAGKPLMPVRGTNISHPYLMLCLMAASVHSSTESHMFFWGFCVLVGWTLWPQRSRWFGAWIWLVALGLAIILGFGGQVGITQAQRFLAGYNPAWLTELGQRDYDPSQAHTSIGQTGRMRGSSRIIVRLQPKPGSRPPMYLRSASYVTFRYTRWSAGSLGETFETVIPETNGVNWALLPTKTNTATNTISFYLSEWKEGVRSGVLPLPPGSGRLENLEAYTLQRNAAGAVVVQGPGLVVFDACHGAGTTVDSAPGTNDVDNVPPDEVRALNRVIAELQLSGLGEEEVLGRLRAFFQDKFVYSTWQEEDKIKPRVITPLTGFLERTHRGHCEYFATATVLLLRQLHIPARYAVGYSVHEPAGRGYVVRGRDAHAWCLVWRNNTWQDFDTTPASWDEAEARTASPFQWLTDVWSRLWYEFSRFRWGHAHLQQYMFLAAVPVLGFLLYQIVFRSNWRLRRKKPVVEPVAPWPGLDSEFYQLERKLTARGFPRQGNEPLALWLERALQSPMLADQAEAIRSLLRLHYRHRFDPAGLAETDREALRSGVQGCLTSLTAGSRP